jgi:hypothetical protein
MEINIVQSLSSSSRRTSHHVPATVLSQGFELGAGCTELCKLPSARLLPSVEANNLI